jgi:acyl-CoA thioesterase-1
MVFLLTAWSTTLAEAHAKSVLIVAIGGDNVYGTGGRRHGGVSQGEAFPAQLQTLLRAQGIPANVINAGISGTTIVEMWNRLDSLVPPGTRLVILNVPKVNDRLEGLHGVQRQYVHKIKRRLRARHIAIIGVSHWRRIPDAVENRDPDQHHFTVKGHAMIAKYLLPKVMAELGKR